MEVEQHGEPDPEVPRRSSRERVPNRKYMQDYVTEYYPPPPPITGERTTEAEEKAEHDRVGYQIRLKETERKKVEKTFTFYHRWSIASGHVKRFSARAGEVKEVASWKTGRVRYPGRNPEPSRTVRLSVEVPGDRKAPERRRSETKSKNEDCKPRPKPQQFDRSERVIVTEKSQKPRTMKRVEMDEIKKGSQVKRKRGCTKGTARKRTDRKKTPEPVSSSSESSSSESSSDSSSESEEEDVEPGKLVPLGAVTMGVLEDIIKEARAADKKPSTDDLRRIIKQRREKKKWD